MHSKKRVLVTDSDYKHALAAIRSLASQGWEVICGSQYEGALGFYSKCCTKSVRYAGVRNEKEFIKSVGEILKMNDVDVLLPIGYLSCVAVSRNYEMLSKITKIPIASFDTMSIASNKAESLRLARELGIPIPKIYKSSSEIEGYPVVVKGIYESGHLCYVNSPSDLSKMPDLDVLMQEYVPGDGYGFFALYNQGRLVASFMHRRIRMNPPTGGSSTAAVSVYDPLLMELGKKLLDALKWHGVAMVEFKKDNRDGKFKLMEINPKFWGSLDLAIACGVDFPSLAARMAVDGDVESSSDYQRGVKFQWPFPDDLMSAIAHPEFAPSFVLDLLNPRVRKNIVMADIKPTIIQLVSSLSSCRRILVNRGAGYPHGVPRQ